MVEQTQPPPQTIPHTPKMTQFQNIKNQEEPGAYGHQRRRRLRSLCCGSLVSFLVLAAIIVLVLWLVYRPHKPKFRVVSAAVYELNLTGSSPALISTSMQFTLVTRNPNRRVSFHYDHLWAFVSYRDQAVTTPLSLPPLLHETKSTVALSPMLGGAAVAVADEVGGQLVEEEGYGVVGLRVVVEGKVRYRVAGGITIRRRGSVRVRCDLLVGLKDGFGGQVPLLQSPPCRVDL